VANTGARPPIFVAGSKAFNECSQIIATAVEYQLPVVRVIPNSHELGVERNRRSRRSCDREPPAYVVDVPIDVMIPTFCTEGIDRAYLAQWGSSYPRHSSLRVPAPERQPRRESATRTMSIDPMKRQRGGT
jgi:hypothetical protein